MCAACLTVCRSRDQPTCATLRWVLSLLVVDGSLGAIRSSLAISDLHGQTNAPGDAHCTQVITHVSDLLQKMGRAGLQPDGATYSVLHGMWLRLGNLPQAVGALAQAKQRAAQSHARSAGGGFRDRIAAADSTDDAASSLPIGEPLWDQVLRDEEIGRHLRSMATVTCLEKRNGKQEDVVRRSRSARAAERLNHNEEEHQGPRAANLEQLCVPLHFAYDLVHRSLV